MSDFYTNFTSLNRRSPRNEGKPNELLSCENLILRDGRVTKVRGTQTAVTGFDDIVTWLGRYYTVETGQASPKSFAYTINGKLWVLDENAGTATEIKAGLNEDAYPKHWIFKTSTQSKLYLVDGKNLYVYDGNNDNTFEDTGVEDKAGNSIKPIDLIEHRDRLFMISNTDLYVSKNLEPEVFDDATDSINILVGSSKGENLAAVKIEDFLFILNTEGIFVLRGDTISALAITFSIDLVEERRIIAGRSATRVEKSIVFLADDYELYAFNGTNTELLTYKEKLSDFINTKRVHLDKAVAVYDEQNKFYMLSFVEKGKTYNNLEVWFDSLEKKSYFIRDRVVSCYMTTDATVEEPFMLLGRSDQNKVNWANRENNFNDDVPIEVKFRTRDITPEKGTNVRFDAFYPEIEPIGDRNIFFRYLIDGRLSKQDDEDFTYNLKGESKGLGFITIANQGQFTGRVRPKINYSRGESIAFELFDSTKDLDFIMHGIGIDIIKKGKKKGKGISK